MVSVGTRVQASGLKGWFPWVTEPRLQALRVGFRGWFNRAQSSSVLERAEGLVSVAGLTEPSLPQCWSELKAWFPWVTEPSLPQCWSELKGWFHVVLLRCENATLCSEPCLPQIRCFLIVCGGHKFNYSTSAALDYWKFRAMQFLRACVCVCVCVCVCLSVCVCEVCL